MLKMVTGKVPCKKNAILDQQLNLVTESHLMRDNHQCIYIRKKEKRKSNFYISSSFFFKKKKNKERKGGGGGNDLL